jgi:hypothetical protein
VQAGVVSVSEGVTGGGAAAEVTTIVTLARAAVVAAATVAVAVLLASAGAGRGGAVREKDVRRTKLSYIIKPCSATV